MDPGLYYYVYGELRGNINLYIVKIHPDSPSSRVYINGTLVEILVDTSDDNLIIGNNYTFREKSLHKELTERIKRDLIHWIFAVLS